MPRTRTIIVVISILSCCALMCVGFSAWSIVTNETFSAISNGAITSEEVIVSDEYVWVITNDNSPDASNTIEKLNEKSFVVSESGFVHDVGDNKKNTEGVLQIPLKIDQEKCYNFSKKVKIDVIVSFQSGYGGLWETNYVSITASCEDTAAQGLNLTRDKSGCAVSFNFEPQKDSTSLELIVGLNMNFFNMSNYNEFYYSKCVTDSAVTNAFRFVVQISEAI